MTSDNVEVVRRTLQSPVFSPEPGGQWTLTNEGAVSYQGPATVTIQVPDGKGGMQAVSVPGMAELQGLYNSKNGTVTVQSGTVRQTMETTSATSVMPKSVRGLFEQFGAQGAVQVTADPSGKALYVKASGGTESRMTDTQQVNVGTLGVDSASAFVMAEHGDPRLTQLIYDPDPTVREARVTQVIERLSSFIGGFYTRKGLSQDSFTASENLNFDVPKTIASLKEKI